MILDLQYEAHGDTVCATVGHVEPATDPQGVAFERFVVDGPEMSRRVFKLADLPRDLVADIRSVLARLEPHVRERMESE